jgi:hypothetical protein
MARITTGNPSKPIQIGLNEPNPLFLDTYTILSISSTNLVLFDSSTLEGQIISYKGTFT